MTTDAKSRLTASSHCCVGTVVLALLTTILFTALLPTPVSARTTRPHQSSFGFSTNPTIGDADPSSLAIDQSNGDVYVVSHGGPAAEIVVSRFTATGAPKDFTAGPDAGTNTLTGFFNPGSLQVAVDNSGGPLNGTIYAAATGLSSPNHATVKVFASSGANLGTISGSGIPQGKFTNETCGAAVDQSSGALYISEHNPDKIWRFAPSSLSGATDDSDYTLTGITVDNPCDLAAASGSVYALSHLGTGSPAIERFSASSFTTNFSNEPQPSPIDTGELSAGPTAVAVDPKTGEVYVNEGHRIAVFDSAGLPLYAFGAAAYFGNRSMALAVKSAASGPASAVYVADPRASTQEVDVFGPLAQTKTFTRPEVASFGPDGTSGSSFPLSRLSWLAFDQSARRLYAVDEDSDPDPEVLAPGIHGFDASSPPAYPPLSGFSPLAVPAIGFFDSGGLAVDNTALGSAGNLYLASGAADLLYGWSPAPTPLGGAFPVDPAISPGPPDGSPKNLCGAAVDSEGNIWVANSSTERVLKYSSAGASLPGAIDTSAQGPPCQLAFDSDDDLYVSIINKSEESKGGVWKYTAVSGYASATKVADAYGINSSNWLAIDPSNDHLYVAVDTACGEKSCNIGIWIDEYDAAGDLVDEFATGHGTFRGIAIDATSHGAYVADWQKRRIRAFGPGVLLPEVTARPASGQTNTAATLNGLVNTQTVALSDCHFEYVSEAAFRLTGFSDLSSGGSVSCTPSAGSIPLDLEEHSVSATATGLTENTAYRFRLSATNVDGTDTAKGVFSSTGRPIVETTGSPVHSATVVRLEGRVNAHGEATTYHFEYGTEGTCDANPCESTETRPAGSGEEIQLVSQRLEGLEPSTTYYYRLIADNDNTLGLGVGASMAVTTHASDAPLSHGDFPGPPGSDRAWEQVNEPDSGGNPVALAFAVSDQGDRAFYRVNGGTPLSSTGSLFTALYAERIETAPHQGGWRSQNIFPPRDQLVGANWLQFNGKQDLSDQVVINQDNVTETQTIWRLRPGEPATKLFEPATLSTLGVSEDASRVLILLQGSLDPTLPVVNSAFNLYDISSGIPKLVGLLPDGSVPPCGGGEPKGLSADGSLVFFKSCTDLYIRDFDAEQTQLIGPGDFAKATPDSVFFTTVQALELGDTGGVDVYRYGLGNEEMKCVTCVVAPGLHAEVTQTAIAADGSRVYFNSSTALLPGAATPGIYRVDVDSGDLAYVAPGANIGENAQNGQAITSDGAALVFLSSDAGLNAVGGQQNANTEQYYRYDDRDRSLTCLSCPQNGSPPVSSVSNNLVGEISGVSGANKTTLSADGDTFAFGTTTPLLSADQNTARAGQDPRAGADLYEWRDGRLLLITDGLTSWPPNGEPKPTAITPSGNDIFFTAATQYTPDALDGFSRLYDARIGGGFEFPPPPKPCPLEVCQGTPKGAPEEQAPGTGAFAGPGNVAGGPARRPCPKGRHKARKGGKARCVKSNGKKPHRKRAKHDRRAQR